jgi:hypothetical protein
MTITPKPHAKLFDNITPEARVALAGFTSELIANISLLKRTANDTLAFMEALEDSGAANFTRDYEIHQVALSTFFAEADFLLGKDQLPYDTQAQCRSETPLSKKEARNRLRELMGIGADIDESIKMFIEMSQALKADVSSANYPFCTQEQKDAIQGVLKQCDAPLKSKDLDASFKNVRKLLGVNSRGSAARGQ